MNERSESRVFDADPAPDHAAGFWPSVERRLADDPWQRPTGDTDPLDLPVASPGRAMRPAPWLAAAAMVVLLAGFGFVLVRALDGGDVEGGSVTDLASGGTVPAPAAAAEDREGDGDESRPSSDAVATTPAQESTGAPAVDGGDDPGPEAGSAAAVETPALAAGVEFEAALGNDDDVVFAPLAGVFPPDARFLATWEARGLSWWSVPDGDARCQEGPNTELRWLTGARVPLDVHDPPLRFSGRIDHFTLEPEADRAAFLTSCLTRSALHVAELGDGGEIERVDLVWVGDANRGTAVVNWGDDTVRMFATSSTGAAVRVEYDTVAGRHRTPNAGPSADEIEHPTARAQTPLAATSGYGVTYWNADDPDGVGRCDGASTSLWLRREPGGRAEWAQATVGDPALGTITAVVVDSRIGRFAFADACSGLEPRVFVGTAADDGSLVVEHQIDFGPYASGHVDELHWIDPDTLSIETDNSVFGLERGRFDYSLSDDTITAHQ